MHMQMHMIYMYSYLDICRFKMHLVYIYIIKTIYIIYIYIFISMALGSFPPNPKFDSNSSLGTGTLMPSVATGADFDSGLGLFRDSWVECSLEFSTPDAEEKTCLICSFWARLKDVEYVMGIHEQQLVPGVLHGLENTRHLGLRLRRCWQRIRLECRLLPYQGKTEDFCDKDRKNCLVCI